jgi:hypothetical protein
MCVAKSLSTIDRLIFSLGIFFFSVMIWNRGRLRICRFGPAGCSVVGRRLGRTYAGKESGGDRALERKSLWHRYPGSRF